MKTGAVTNKDIFSIDWAQEERQKAIRALSKGIAVKRPARVMPAFWMVDVSGSDKRSVKAQLKGEFSLRASWWNVFSTVHQLFSRTGSLESAMYSFHKFHHAVTLSAMETSQEYWKLVESIKKDGIGKASKDYFAGIFTESKTK